MSEAADVFEPPAEASPDAKPDVIKAPLPGGEWPDPLQLFQDTFKEVIEDVGPYVLAGLGQMLVMVPVVLGLVFFIYFGMLFWMFGGFVVTGIAAAIAIEVGGEAVGTVLSLIVMLVWYLGGFIALFGISAAIGACLAPMNASLVRRVAMHQRGEKELDLGASFSHMNVDVMSVILVSFGVGFIVSVGFLFLYIPGIIGLVFLGHASALVVLHRRGAVNAMSTSASHVMSNPAYYGMFWLLYIGISLIAAYIPLLGTMYLLAVHVKAHRTLFGDGEEAVVASA